MWHTRVGLRLQTSALQGGGAEAVTTSLEHKNNGMDSNRRRRCFVLLNIDLLSEVTATFYDQMAITSP